MNSKEVNCGGNNCKIGDRFNVKKIKKRSGDGLDSLIKSKSQKEGEEVRENRDGRDERE